MDDPDPDPDFNNELGEVSLLAFKKTLRKDASNFFVASK